jgi:putative ABC transport system substrate-binding protein
LRQRLRELGYLEGQNIAFEPRFAEGQTDRLAGLAAELVALKVDVIVTSGTPASLAAKQATLTIPIVMAQLADPVGSGLVASLGRPGGNVTGLSTQDADLSGKRLGLLKEIVPTVSRIALLIDETNPGTVLIAKGTQAAARSAGVQLQSLGVRDPGELDRAFSAMKEARAGALIVESSSLLFTSRTRLADLALKNRLPTMFAQREYAEAGGLMAYSADFLDLFRRTATFVDKILKGAKPADLPVEQPTKMGVRDQPQDRQGPRPHDSAVGAAAGGPSDPVMGPTSVHHRGGSEAYLAASLPAQGQESINVHALQSSGPIPLLACSMHSAKGCASTVTSTGKT